MKVSKILIGMLFLLVSISSSGCMHLTGVDGNGDVIKEVRDVSSFDGIKVGGAFNVILSQENIESLTIEADANLMSIIESKVRGGVLIISTRENIRDAKELNLYISFKDINLIDVSGACELSNKGTMKLSSLNFEGSGASDINLDLVTDKLICDFSGASEIDLRGKAKLLKLELSGASELNAYDFVVDQMDIDISGAGEAEVHATSSLKVSVSGAASIKYMGSPSIEQDISGAGSVRKR